MNIKAIPDEDIMKMKKLIWDTFLKFISPDLSDEGIKKFNEIISNNEFISSLQKFGYYENDDLQGIIAMNKNHISLFFVRGDCSGKGIGRMLWNYVKDNSKDTFFTVKSSVYALAIYHKLGFYDTDIQKEKDGIIYTSMEFKK